jgi:protein-tyrosine phosphatase
MAHDRFEVLFVCHANLCRSPMAERIANRAFADRIGVRGSGLVVSSAGTHARPGLPMHPGAVEALGERGVYAGRFESRVLTPPMLDGPDLVLTATREQRAACMRMAPAAARRTFTLRQFGRMAAAALGAAENGGRPNGTAGSGSGNRPNGTGTVTLDSPAQRVRVLLAEAAAARTRTRLTPLENDDDLPDPVRQPIEAFRACAKEIQSVLDALIAVIESP